MRILIIGLTKELPLSPFDAMDIADKLVARAANAHTSGKIMHTHLPRELLLLWLPTFALNLFEVKFYIFIHKLWF